MTGRTVELADAAGQLAGLGFHVFPCRPGDKRPAIDQWEQRASADPGHVRAAWSGRYAGCNIGLACGPSGLVVLDLDTHGTLPGEWRLPGLHDGRDVFAQLCEWAGQDWPVTRWTLTPSGGWHLWFRSPEGVTLRNTAGLLGPMVDTRAAGGYIVVPPSEVGGRAYDVAEDMTPAPLPAWLARALTSAPAAPRARRVASGPTGPNAARLRGLVETVRAGKPGDRNGPLFWAACRLGELVMMGEADRADASALVDAAIDAGLRGGDREAWQTVRSGFSRGAGEAL